MEHPVADAKPFAAVLRIIEQAYLRMQLGELAHDGTGGVGRSVVDYQDFCMPITLMNAAQNLVQGFPDAGAFVVGRNYDTDEWSFQN